MKWQAPAPPDELDDLNDHGGEAEGEEQQVIEVPAVEWFDEGALRRPSQAADDERHDQ
jgi:hypothetical protein